MGKRTSTATWIEAQSRWRISVQKDGERKSFYSSTAGRTGQREAHAKADAWLDENITTNARVNALWERYIKKVEATTSASNVRKIKSHGENHILPCIGHLKIDCVTESHLQSILDAAYKSASSKTSKQRKPRPDNEPLSRKTLLNLAYDIKAFIKYCRVMERATTLLPENLSIPKNARYKGKTILQPKNLTVLFSVDTTILRGKRVFDEYIYAYRFQVSCGLRPGELIGLQVGDITTNDEVRVCRSINSMGETTQGKNRNAVRSFVMPQQAKKAYEAQLALLQASGVQIDWNTPLFQIESQHTYYGRWSAYLKSNDLPHISPYELRHTFVSIAKHLPDGQIRPIVGHSRSMDTFGQYGHILDGEQKQTAQSISELFEKVISEK